MTTKAAKQKTKEEQAERAGEWGVLEIMGKVRLGGFVSEVLKLGTPLIRIDIPDGKGGFAMTRFYHPNALYCFTPTDEKAATAVALRNIEQPVHVWEMPERKAIGSGNYDEF